MLQALKDYFILIKISIKCQLKYKLDFFVQLIIWSIYAFIPIIAVDLLIKKFGNLGNWTQYNIFIGYAVIMLSYDLARMIARGFDNFHNYVENGSLDIILVKPLGVFLQIMGNEFFLRRFSGIISYIFLLFLSISKLDIEMNKLYISIFILFIVISIVLLFISLLIFSSIFTLIFKKRNLISEILVDKTAFISYVPTNMLNKIVKTFLIYFIPIYFCYYIPMNKIFICDFYGSIILSIFISLLISITSLYIIKKMFIKILRRFYVSKGN